MANMMSRNLPGWILFGWNYIRWNFLDCINLGGNFTGGGYPGWELSEWEFFLGGVFWMGNVDREGGGAGIIRVAIFRVGVFLAPHVTCLISFMMSRFLNECFHWVSLGTPGTSRFGSLFISSIIASPDW